MKRSNILFSCIFLICLLFRVIEKVFFIDPESGFYLRTGFFPFIFPCILLLYFSISRIAVTLKSTSFTFIPRPTGGTVALLMGLGITVGCGINLVCVLLQQKQYVPLHTTGLFFLYLAVQLLGLCSAIVFFRLFRTLLLGQEIKIPLLMGIVPVFWMLLDAVFTFISYPQIVNIPDRIYEMLGLLCAVLFLLSLTRIFTQTADQKHLIRFRLYGRMTALLWIPLVLGQWLLFDHGVHIPLGEQLIQLAVGVFSGIYSFYVTEKQ